MVSEGSEPGWEEGEREGTERKAGVENFREGGKHTHKGEG